MSQTMETYSPCVVCGRAVRQLSPRRHVKYCSPKCQREARKKGAVR